MDMWLPIGSVVLLKESDKLLMIYGRAQSSLESEDDAIWDYVGCPYPEGNLGANYTYLFNKDLIDHVFFVGFQSPEEMGLSKRLDDLIAEATDMRLTQTEDSAT